MVSQVISTYHTLVKKNQWKQLFFKHCVLTTNCTVLYAEGLKGVNIAQLNEEMLLQHKNILYFKKLTLNSIYSHLISSLLWIIQKGPLKEDSTCFILSRDWWQHRQ